jgi:hypothetical protein
MSSRSGVVGVFGAGDVGYPFRYFGMIRVGRVGEDVKEGQIGRKPQSSVDGRQRSLIR